MALKAVKSLGASRRAKRQAFDAERRKVKPSRKWYSSARWQKLRAAELRDEPLCAYCLAKGKVVEANVRDHVHPHRQDEHLFWYGERQSLCTPCHSSVKQREERGV